MMRFILLAIALSFAAAMPVEDTTDDDCIQGICQTTTIPEINGALMSNLSPSVSEYMWSQANSNGTFMFATDTVAYVSFAQVKAQLEAMPKAFEEGSIFKPNDLGLLRLNSKIFSYGRNPDIALSMNAVDHAIVRPVMEAMFANESEWSTETFTNEAESWLNSVKHASGTFSHDDVGTWTQQMLHKYGMRHEISAEQAVAFQAYAKGALVNAILPKAVFNPIVEKGIKTSEARAKNAELIRDYGPLAKSRCPFLNDDEASKVAHGLIDGALTFAGGLSMPSIITSMLGVLFSGDYGDFSATYNSPAYLWETVRYFPAVVGVPFARTGTTQREAAILPSALRDPAVWGTDANKFTLRSESVYSGNIDVAWAGPAYSSEYPKQSHNCPGTAMSKAIMLGFMKAFNKQEWESDQKPKLKTKGPVGWNSFVLNHKSTK